MRCSADIRPRTLNLEMVGDEDDLLFQIAFDWQPKRVEDRLAFRRAFVRGIGGLGRRGKAEGHKYQNDQRNSTHLFLGSRLTRLKFFDDPVGIPIFI